MSEHVPLKKYDNDHFYFGDYLVDLIALRHLAEFTDKTNPGKAHSLSISISNLSVIARELNQNKPISKGIYSSPQSAVTGALYCLRKLGAPIPESALEGKL
jgi:hypothetical protein